MSSSSSNIAAAYRKCVRLKQPTRTTFEYLVGANLVIEIDLTYSEACTFVEYAAGLTGPDTIVVNYADQIGQSSQLTINLVLWASDTGWIFISNDGSRQYLIGGLNGAFFDAVATNINNRNVNNGYAPLWPCTTLERYDCTNLAPNQIRPVTFIVDGLVISEYATSSLNSSSSLSGQALFDPTQDGPGFDPTANP